VFTATKKPRSKLGGFVRGCDLVVAGMKTLCMGAVAAHVTAITPMQVFRRW
jgi:hypothetical protein